MDGSFVAGATQEIAVAREVYAETEFSGFHYFRSEIYVGFIITTARFILIYYCYNEIYLHSLLPKRFI